MKKLMLRMEDLRVDTFTAEAEKPAGRGTVAAHYGANHTLWITNCGGDTCNYTCSGYATSPGPDQHCVAC